MPEVRCFLSLTDGKVLKLPPGDPGMVAVQANQNEYVPVDTVPSRIQYQWVDEFTKTIEDEGLRERVEAAINGKGAFRRFKDILLTVPDERRRWFEFRDLMMRQRVVDWVREKGIQPTNDPPWTDEAGEPVPMPENHPRDVEALRDLVIAWFDGKEGDAAALQPLELEKLASEISARFKIEPH